MTPSGTHQDSHNQQMCGEQAARGFTALQAEVEGLKALFLFSQARKLLAQARPENMADPRQRHWVFQQLALCTYKDEELPPEKRFAQALAILETHLGVRAAACDDAEVLGLAGAVYKRKWEHGGQLEHLHTALYFYRRGWQEGTGREQASCGVNAAFIMDLLEYRAKKVAAREQLAQTREESLVEEAGALRQQIRATLAGQVAAQEQKKSAHEYLFAVTMAEVCWGLGDWAQAGEWLGRAAQAAHDEWARQATARQLVAIARMQGVRPPAETEEQAEWHPAWQALSELLQEDTRAALSCHRGKVGLALSGGGFRAALFHLGVLARLAECDVLRSVEVLSTVSGGSIVGAQYYLELRKLLQSTVDRKITREDYVELVRRVLNDFLRCVEKNLRVQALASLSHNRRMLFSKNYGRSHRMGELYDQYLYATVTDGQYMATPRRLRDLLIHPRIALPEEAGETQDNNFKPKFSNWRRTAKVPILLLNTTSLNSGHNWHFTASWMGEPPGLLGEEVDMNVRYRRLYYRDAPSEELRNYPLGYAVAASAGVPALFEPLPLEGLYAGRTVRLVDGGVHDNQGVAGLLDEACNLIFCSDASGQMEDQANPASGLFSVFYRADSILQDRLRETQYKDLRDRLDSQALQGLFFIHLKSELETSAVSWVGCTDEKPEPDRSTRTSYGVDRTIQRLLSEVRTDLDSFTEVEAYALMASGYLMTTHQLVQRDQEQCRMGLTGHWGDFDIAAPQGGAERWPFMPMVEIMAKDPESSDQRRHELEKQLKVSASLFGKAWKLSSGLKGVAVGLGLLLVVSCCYLLLISWSSVYEVCFSVGPTVAAILLSLAALFVPAMKLLQPKSSGRSLLLKVVAATLGWIGFNLHLKYIDPIFLKQGRLARLLRLPVE